MAKRFFFAAGETQDAMVAESESCPACLFSYVPPTVDQEADYEQRLDDVRSDARKIAKLARRVIADHVKAWDVIKGDGSPVDPKSVDETNRVDPNLIGRVFGVIRRRSCGDLPADDAAEDAEVKN